MAAPTLLFINSSTTAAYCPAGHPRLVVQPADPAGDVGRGIEAILAMLPRRAKHLYLLSTDVWSQSVTVETRALRRVDKSQIPQLLAYEAESLSGMSGAQARTAVRPLESSPLESSFWVSQIDNAQFAQIADAIAFSGGRLVGMQHPAGLPAAIGRAKSNWSRVEIWDDVALAVEKPARGPVQHRFLDLADVNIANVAAVRSLLRADNGEPSSVVELLRESPPALSPDATSPDNPLDAATLNLQREADLERFLASWAGRIKSTGLRRAGEVPVIQPVRAPVSAQTRRTAALAVTAAAIVGVVVHGSGWGVGGKGGIWHKSRIASLTEEKAALQEPVDAFASEQKRLTKLQGALTTTTSQVSALSEQVSLYQDQVHLHRSRVADLLSLLADERSNSLVIKSIESSGDRIRVVGRCVDAREAAALAETLADRLAPMRLSLHVPRCEALLLHADGSPFEFEYVIQDI